jgi:pSer/pThr/pTyr-binding forkhead associated (FHA) protein
VDILIVTCTLNGEIVGQHAFTKPRVVIGRGSECDIVLENPGISRQHAEILRAESSFVIKDLGSANGTLLNKSRVAEAELGETDVLQIGKFVLHTRVTSDALAAGHQAPSGAPWQRDPTIRAKG